MTNLNKVRALGAWRSITDQFVKVGGEWKTVSKVYVKVGGSWHQSYPYPPEKDTTLTSLTVNGTEVLGTLAYAAATNSTSVTIAATASNTAATVTGTGSKTVNYSTNPNSLNVVVTSEDGTKTATYTVVVTVAAPTQTTIYYTYCSGYSSTGGSYLDTTTTDPTTACNNRRAALGNPSSWSCGGSGMPSYPDCGPIPCTPCCSVSYTVFDGGGNGRCNYTDYYSDACCSSACQAPRHYYITVCHSCACPV
jgi:hypothetical protein